LTKVYLAHSGDEKEQGRFIQQELESFGYIVLNPFAKHNPYVKDLKWEKGKVVGSLGDSACEWIVETDLKFIDEADMMVIIYPQNSPTIGTPCEMMYGHMKGKPMVIYTPTKFEHHPWIQYMAQVQFTDIIGLLCYMEVKDH
jgi:nucleoside 2-deoxyribosyltransferase